MTIAANHEQPARRRLRRGLPAGLVRLHWHDDRQAVRAAGLQLIAGLPLEGLSVYRIGVARPDTERARQHALWNLVVALRDRGVHEVVFEARERTQNRRDQATLAAINKAGVAGSAFRYSFARPLDEPLLWPADYLAGACGHALHHGDESYQQQLPDKLLEARQLPPLP